MDQVCMQCVVEGRVQGVWFRQATCDKARALGLTGWVKNLNNGRVEVLCCGTPECVAELQAWLHVGPNNAEVQSVIAQEQPWQDFNDFVIQR